MMICETDNRAQSSMVYDKLSGQVHPSDSIDALNSKEAKRACIVCQEGFAHGHLQLKVIL